MKNRKAILFLLLAIAVLVAAEVALNVVGRKPRVATRAFLCEGAAESTELTLARRGEPVIQVEKDGPWRLRRPFAAIAETPVVLKLLDTLAQARVEESISDAELLRWGRTRADYALDEPPLRVGLSNATARVSLSFGLLTPSGDGVYASVDGEPSVLIVPSSVLAAVDLPVERLRRRRLFGFGETTVVAFDVKQNPGAILSFQREGDGWQVGRGRAAATAVSKFLSDLMTAQASRFVWPTGATNESEQASASLLAGYGLDPETAVTVTLKRSGGRNSSISFGKRADAETVYAYLHVAGTVVTVPSALKDEALQDGSRFADARLFLDSPEKVAFVTLADGGLALSLSRADTSGWRLDAPISAPADVPAVEALLARVLSLTSADLDPDGVAVSLGASSRAVSVARTALFPTGGGFEQLRSREIVAFADEDVKRLVATRATDGARGVSVVFARDRRVWNVESAPEGSVASPTGIARVLDALAPLRAVRVEKLKVMASELAFYGLEHPFLTLAVDLDRADAVRRNIFVGAPAVGGGRYATVGSSDAVFVISDADVTALTSPLVGE